jgi:tetratricopeptide (TPR) repeat protein
LRIQAWHLHETDAPECLRAALELLDKLLAEYSNDIELAPAYVLQAECWLGLGQVQRALDSYRKAMQREQDFPNVKAGARLGFGWTVIELELAELYEEVAALLEESGKPHSFLFPIEKYRFSAILALIEEERGNHQKARHHAQIALDAARQRHSGLRYHSRLGLVEDTTTKIHARLERLVRTLP